MDTGLSGYEHQPFRNHPILDQILEGWTGVQKDTVHLLINKYGLPNEASSRRAIWYNNGPWKRTIVYLDAKPHNFPTPHLDYLEQTIDYKVPVQFFDELAHFDGSLYLDRTGGEASAKCDQEAANFMALNLMNDIVTGRRNVEDARSFAIQIEKGLRINGQSSPYFERFLFPKQSLTADPDVRYF
jgi:hypothetical protein